MWKWLAKCSPMYPIADNLSLLTAYSKIKTYFFNKPDYRPKYDFMRDKIYTQTISQITFYLLIQYNPQWLSDAHIGMHRFLNPSTPVSSSPPPVMHCRRVSLDHRPTSSNQFIYIYKYPIWNHPPYSRSICLQYCPNVFGMIFFFMIFVFKTFPKH